MEWYYADEADQQISFQEEEFKRLIELGSIKADTLVWNSAMPDWRKASSVQPMLFSPSALTTAPVAADGLYSPPMSAPPMYSTGVPPQTDGLGVASLVCGILSVLMCCGYGIGVFPGVAAIICGHISRKKSMAIGPHATSGMTTAGLIMGYIGTVISVIFGIIMIVAIVYAISQEGMIE